jgi:hypothetical protein
MQKIFEIFVFSVRAFPMMPIENLVPPAGSPSQDKLYNCDKPDI